MLSAMRMHFVDIPAIGDILVTVNGMGPEDIWNDASPIWARPENRFGFYRGFLTRNEMRDLSTGNICSFWG